MMIDHPVTRPLTKAEREALQRRKCEQLRLGKLLSQAYDAGQLKEMLAELKAAQGLVSETGPGVWMEAK